MTALPATRVQRYDVDDRTYWVPWYQGEQLDGGTADTVTGAVNYLRSFYGAPGVLTAYVDDKPVFTFRPGGKLGSYKAKLAAAA